MGLAKKLTAFGDSVMKGVLLESVGRDRTPHYVIADNTFFDQCGRRLGCEAVNFGKFGGTVTAGLGIIDRHIDDISHSKYVLLEYGGNDSDFDWDSISKNPDFNHVPHTPLRTFALAYKEIIDKVRDNGARPVVLSLPPLCSERYFNHFTRNMDDNGKNNVKKWLGGSCGAINSWHELYNLEIFKLGFALNVPVIDITSAFLSRRDYTPYLCSDGIHPNQSGQGLIADAVCSFFLKFGP